MLHDWLDDLLSVVSENVLVAANSNKGGIEILTQGEVICLGKKDMEIELKKAMIHADPAKKNLGITDRAKDESSSQ